MTPTFSTVVNFSVKGILGRIHKLNFLSSMECTEKLTFPRVQRRLLQCKDESEATFQLCQIDDIEREIKMAKEQAIDIASSCGMCLESYEDTYLLENLIQLLHNAIDDDGEDEEYVENPAATTTDDIFDNIDPVLIQEDLSNLRLKKSSKPGIPTYEVSVDKGLNISKSYSLQKNKKSPFILYNDKYIRKSPFILYNDKYIRKSPFILYNDKYIRKSPFILYNDKYIRKSPFILYNDKYIRKSPFILYNDKYIRKSPFILYNDKYIRKSPFILYNDKYIRKSPFILYNDKYIRKSPFILYNDKYIKSLLSFYTTIST